MVHGLWISIWARHCICICRMGHPIRQWSMHLIYRREGGREGGRRKEEKDEKRDKGDSSEDHYSIPGLLSPSTDGNTIHLCNIQ